MPARRFRWSTRAVLGALVLLHSAAGIAQTAPAWPVKPIRFILPFAPGGPTELIARPYAAKLSEALGQAIVIDSRGGGGGIIGTDAVAKAAPDGYTMLMASFSFALNQFQFKDLPYDTVRDFAGVSLLAKAPLLLVVNPSLPAKSIKEFIALARARPGELNFSSTGPAASGTLAATVFQSMTGVQFTPINYKGQGPGSLAVISGEVQFTFFSIPVGVSFVKSGKLRALGVTSAKRSSLMPEVPTIAEGGLPGYEEVAWYGVLVPVRTPQSVIAKLNSETVRVLQSADIRKTFTALGIEPAPTSPAEMSEHISSETAKWSKLLKDLPMN